MRIIGAIEVKFIVSFGHICQICTKLYKIEFQRVISVIRELSLKKCCDPSRLQIGSLHAVVLVVHHIRLPGTSEIHANLCSNSRAGQESFGLQAKLLSSQGESLP